MDGKDKPVMLALSALVLSLWLTAGASLAESPAQPNTQQCQATANQNCVAPKLPEETFWQRTKHDPISFYTFVMAIFTVVLAGTSFWQGRLTRRTIDLARDEFISTHRPRIRMRLLKITPVKIDQPISIQFTLINVGATDAVDISGSLVLTVIIVSKHGEVSEQKWMATFSQKGTSLPAGGHVLVSIPTKAIPDSSWGRTLESIEQRVTVEGRVSYNDARDVRRLTGFYRRSSGDPNRFFRIGDRDIEADYEYED